jgi:glycosyltransferase involved in cell wall biosynthesis
MRMLHVSQPVEAGVAHVVLALVADQVARGYDVHVACPPGPGLAERAGALGATVHAWAAVRSPGPAVAGETRRLARVIDAADPDVVVLHSAKAGLAGRLALRGRRPTVHVPHAWSFEAVSGAVERASRAWEVRAARWTDLVVCVSADERDRGRAAGVVTCAAEVIPNGVDTETRVPRDGVAARAALGLPEAPTVVCVGRLAEQKGQDTLLETWAEVRAAVPDAQLVLVGDGPMRASLEASAAAGVTFAGTRTDVDAWLAAAHVVALPSRWESTPLVSLEAMAAGRPVVAFEVDGVRAAFGPTGVVLVQGDVAGLTESLCLWLRAPVASAAAGRAARERVVAVGDLRATLKQWDAALTALVARPPAPVGGPPVSVVVTVLNEGPELAGSVRALLGQLSPGDELVLVDGGSTDGSVAALEPHPALRVLLEPGAGISAGRNAGVRAAAHDVVVVTDAGCTPEPGFVDAMRRPFGAEEPPALAQGVYRVLAGTPLEAAQSLACYPQPAEVPGADPGPDALVRAYTRVFGTGFDPRFAVGRCVAFTRAAWTAAGGFPEDLATGEDVAFGLAVARHGACVAVPDAVVGWKQRDGLAATWRMYRGYGRASTADPRMLARDAVRGAAYLLAPALASRPGGRRLLAAGTVAYLSLPAVRAARAHAAPAAVALLPVALATKDLGKMAGALEGLAKRWRA